MFLKTELLRKVQAFGQWNDAQRSRRARQTCCRDTNTSQEAFSGRTVIMRAGKEPGGKRIARPGARLDKTTGKV